MDRLKGKKALVIGGSTGIGASTCILFAQEGADVAVAGPTYDAAERAKVVERIRQIGRQVIELEVDVLKEEQIKTAVDQTIEAFGHIDIMFNNAGISGHQGPIWAETVEEFSQVMNINCRGIFFGMKHVLPHMLERGYGRIINTASQLSHKASPLNASYCASKAAVASLSASVAQEVALKGITVNSLCPGPTDTPMWQRPGNEDWKKWKLDSLPMKRLGTPEEQAWAVVYMASDEASYLTGQSISPNGGDVMW